MYRAKQSVKSSRGYALIVVLSTLSLLALLFAMTSLRSLSNIHFFETEKKILVQNERKTHLLRAALSALKSDSARVAQGVQITWSEENVELEFQDVGGLVDLNTADLTTLHVLFDHLELNREALDRYVAWKQSGSDLVRLETFLQIVEAPEGLSSLLHTSATLWSGRRGISIDVAPMGLVDADARAPIAGTRSPSSRVNFHVLEVEERRSKPIGVISTSGSNGQILAIFTTL